MNLRDGMYLRKMTIMKLATLSGVHQATLSNYRMGHSIPSPDHVKKIETALDLKGGVSWPEKVRGVE